MRARDRADPTQWAKEGTSTWTCRKATRRPAFKRPSHQMTNSGSLLLRSATVSPGFKLVEAAQLATWSLLEVSSANVVSTPVSALIIATLCGFLPVPFATTSQNCSFFANVTWRITLNIVKSLLWGKTYRLIRTSAVSTTAKAVQATAHNKSAIAVSLTAQVNNTVFYSWLQTTRKLPREDCFSAPKKLKLRLLGRRKATKLAIDSTGDRCGQGWGSVGSHLRRYVTWFLARDAFVGTTRAHHHCYLVQAISL